MPCKGEKAIYTRHASAQASTKRAKNTVSPEKKIICRAKLHVNEGTNLDPLASGLDALTTRAARKKRDLKKEI
jgi:hypothetical protein